MLTKINLFLHSFEAFCKRFIIALIVLILAPLILIAFIFNIFSFSLKNTYQINKNEDDNEQ